MLLCIALFKDVEMSWCRVHHNQFGCFHGFL
jgi:hypothetical protein